MEIDLELIKTLIEILKQANITELTVEAKDYKVTIKQAPTVQMPPHPEPSWVEEVQTTEKPKEEPQNIIVTAPRVGILRWNPAKQAKPKAVGDIVKADEAICAIESMSILNDIKSEVTGKIVDILVEDGQPVEYGQQLLVIEPLKELEKQLKKSKS